ncbi:hypothetical protein [Nocardioides nitrophenolicus]|uniref:hypothetical protein n=1 Tax=Nocardioides nitrophenolicus TaxID=60489 RepID=UPI00195BC753|nr:hypothetical protein [Nocardioides nitrophenolicus]MBM7519504.1 hypothetical protein [Nocardioides nitrophenolicus]
MTATSNSTTSVAIAVAAHEKKFQRQRASLMAKRDQAAKVLRDREQAAADAAERLDRLKALIADPLSDARATFADLAEAEARTAYADLALAGARKTFRNITASLGSDRHIELGDIVAAAFGTHLECEFGATTGDGFDVNSLDHTHAVVVRVIESTMRDDGGLVGHVEVTRLRRRTHAPIDLELVRSACDEAGIPTEKLAPGTVTVRTAEMQNGAFVDTVRLRLGPVTTGDLVLGVVSTSNARAAGRTFAMAVGDVLQLRELGSFDDDSFAFGDLADGRLFLHVADARVVSDVVSKTNRQLKIAFKVTYEAHGLDRSRVASALRETAAAWGDGITVLGTGEVTAVAICATTPNTVTLHDSRAWLSHGVMVETSQHGPWSAVSAVAVELTARSSAKV